MTLSPAFMRTPIRVGGEWLYSLVLVEAARRPFNRTQLESLSGPIEKIDTNGSSEQILIHMSDIRHIKSSFLGYFHVLNSMY